jgi:transposase
MMLAFIDVHKHVFQACVLDAESGEASDQRFCASREALAGWLEAHPGLGTVAIEATTGWRWVCRELEARGLDVRLVDAGETKARQGSKRRAKTDRLDARFGVQLLARELLPEAWLAPEEIQRLRDQTRLRQALRQERTRWAQRLHALLQHEGYPVARERLLTKSARRWVDALPLCPQTRAHADALWRLIDTHGEELERLDQELARFARSDARTQALMQMRGVGPVIAATLLAEIGDAKRFRRARQVVRAAGLDPTVHDSGDTKRRGRLSKAGSPQLRWALVEAASGWASRPGAPDHPLHNSVKTRLNAQNANLTAARKLANRAYHTSTSFRAPPKAPRSSTTKPCTRPHQPEDAPRSPCALTPPHVPRGMSRHAPTRPPAPPTRAPIQGRVTTHANTTRDHHHALDLPGPLHTGRTGEACLPRVQKMAL